jgi:hypothetical protein
VAKEFERKPGMHVCLGAETHQCVQDRLTKDHCRVNGWE